MILGLHFLTNDAEQQLYSTLLYSTALEYKPFISERPDSLYSEAGLAGFVLVWCVSVEELSI